VPRYTRPLATDSPKRAAKKMAIPDLAVTMVLLLPRFPPAGQGLEAVQVLSFAHGDEDVTGFEGRIVPKDGKVADACGRLLARARQAGRGLGAMDALIAATCLACDLVLATRNLADFDGLGIAFHAP